MPSPTLTPKILSAQEVEELSCIKSQHHQNSLMRDRSRDEREIQAKKEYIEDIETLERNLS